MREVLDAPTRCGRRRPASRSSPASKGMDWPIHGDLHLSAGRGLAAPSPASTIACETVEVS